MDTSKLVVLIWALPVLTVLAIFAIIIRFVSIKKHCPPSKDTTINLQLTEPYYSPSSSSPPSYDVFLSFYGKDTRRSFISHLYTALDQAGILTFRDDPALEKGQEISSGLLDAIKHSKIFIVVVSENYARSSWCLNELVQILSCKRTEIQVVPVFYYVDPSDVRHHKRSFGEALDGHKKRYSVDMIEKWKSALSQIAELSGHHLRKEANENESDTIHEIVGNVATRASTMVSHLEKHLFGIDSAVEEIYQTLRMESNDVRAIGICGMGGIGKTTIAKVFYDKHFNTFDISCFNENVKQYSQGGSHLLPLLERLLIDLLGKEDCKVTDVESGIRKLKNILHHKKALIVLDDLHQSYYSELLANLGNLFSAGSRIIITTRDSNVLNKLKVDIPHVDIYMVKTLGHTDSLELFSYHAFKRSVPPPNFRELSLRFVTYAGGLPLALKVLGSSLLGRTYEFWKAKLEKVQEIPEIDIHKILKLSYDELDDETEKAIFLDIAFFFVGKDKDEAIHVFKSCNFFPDVGIPILVDRCLLTIGADNTFEMHNLIQDMGKKLGKNTRLFLRGNAWEDLQNLEEMNDIEGLILDLSTSTDGQISASLFEKMYNIRLLQIIDARDIQGNFKNLFPKLRCIRWRRCPWTHMPSTFRPQNLISIDMPFSRFKILWKGPMSIKQLNNLCCLDLYGCGELKQLPDKLGDMKALKKIDAGYTAIEKLPDSVTQLKELSVLCLWGCEKLRKLPEQIGNMQGLRTFDARYTAIEKLPDSVTQLKELSMLHLFGCKKLRKLPEQIGNMQGLREFDASLTAIEKLPDSVTQLKELSMLYLGGCKKLRKLPEQIGNMQGLRTFSASYTAIQQLPDSFVGLINLETLNLSGSENLRNLPNSIWKLKSLKDLDLSVCSKLERLPEQLGKMQCLERLVASYTAIEEVPDSIGLLSRLRKLEIGSKKLKCVPESIWNLTSIQYLTSPLDLTVSGDTVEISLPESNLGLSCYVSISLPMIQFFSSLERLTLSDEGHILSSEKSFNLSKLFNLRTLRLDNCTSLGSSLPKLPLNLEELSIFDHISLEQLPDLSSLRKLGHLYIQGCINLQSISLLPYHLQSLAIRECTSLQDLPDLSMLKELETLEIKECSNLKSISLKPSSLQVGQPRLPFRAHLPNREVAEWFNYKSSGLTVSFDIPPSFGSNFLGLALWVVYTCKSTVLYQPYIRAVITNNTESITETYPIYVHALVGEEKSKVQCIKGEKISMKSGDRIKVSVGSLIYNYFNREDPIGEVKVKMFGVHMIQFDNIT